MSKDSKQLVFDRLVCPVCTDTHLAPESKGYALVCRKCRRTYGTLPSELSMIPNPLPDELATLAKLWQKLQANGAVSYELAPEINLFRSGSPEVKSFVEFMQLEGTVLDVGCGPQRDAPAYIEDAAILDYIGIEPLRGAELRDFTFIHGLGECIPFAKETFDHVIFSSSIDHLMDFRRGIREAARVLKPNGKMQFCLDLIEDDSQNSNAVTRVLDIVRRSSMQVFNGIRLMGVRRTAIYLIRASQFRIPEGAKDFFHVYFPTKNDVLEELQRNGLTVSKEGQHGEFYFLQAEKR